MTSPRPEGGRQPTGDRGLWCGVGRNSGQQAAGQHPWPQGAAGGLSQRVGCGGLSCDCPADPGGADATECWQDQASGPTDAVGARCCGRTEHPRQPTGASWQRRASGGQSLGWGLRQYGGVSSGDLQGESCPCSSSEQQQRRLGLPQAPAAAAAAAGAIDRRGSCWSARHMGASPAGAELTTGWPSGFPGNAFPPGTSSLTSAGYPSFCPRYSSAGCQEPHTRDQGQDKDGWTGWWLEVHLLHP